MSLLDLLRTALRSVSVNKLRAALTMLGVVIGVASVIAMLALGNGARAAVDAIFASLGANQIQIGQKFSMQEGEFKPTGEKLTYTEGLDMAQLPLIERVEMAVNKTTKARFGKNTVEITAIGTTADALDGIVASGDVQPVGWKSNESFSAEDFIREGRFFSADEVFAGYAPDEDRAYWTAYLDWLERTTTFSVSVAKAGITARLQCRCSILGAANPKYGRFEESQFIADQAVAAE